MCTVVVLPAPGGYVLGHNRDEALTRARGLPPTEHTEPENRYLAPTDPDSGGTWLVANRHGTTVCILNAADAEGRDLPAAPRSRGRLVRDAAAARDARDVLDRLARSRATLAATRAFELVVVEPPGASETSPAVARVRWDGVDLRADRPAVPALFVSALRTQRAAEEARGETFGRLLAEVAHPVGEERLVRFLASHDPTAGALSVCVHRDDAATVATTIVRATPRDVVVTYLDGAPCAPGTGRSESRIAVG